jgi:hypothetical protein
MYDVISFSLPPCCFEIHGSEGKLQLRNFALEQSNPLCNACKICKTLVVCVCAATAYADIGR